MATINFDTVLDNLKTDLEARANLSGVKVRTLPTDPATDPKEGISFDRVTGSHEYLAMGHSYIEDFQLDGRIWAIAAETGDETGTASRARAVVFLQELVAVLEDDTATVYTPAKGAFLNSFEYQPFVLGDGRMLAQIGFSVMIKATV